MADSTLVILQSVLLVAAGCFILYLALLSLLALFARFSPGASSPLLRRIAVVVPAHNEELSITKTLQNLRSMHYDREMFDLIVIADNCTDRTASLAAAQGAKVMERSNKEFRGKGYALRWCFDQLVTHDPPYDAVVVIDADSVASPNFLAVMNDYLARGAAAVQSSDMVAEQAGIWSSEVTRLGFTLYNYVRPLGRRLIGFSAGLRGNGMCFATETLRNIPWNAFSLSEDLEYGLELLLHDIPTVFAPEAKVYAIMPTNAANAETQRARWEKGRRPVVRRYAPALLRHGIAGGSLRCIDALLDLIMPPFVNLAGLVLLMFIVNAFLLLLGWSAATTFLLWWGSLWMLILVHVIGGLYAADADALLYRSLLYIPRYALWKVMLYAKLAGAGAGREWIRTAREQNTTDTATKNSAKD